MNDIKSWIKQSKKGCKDKNEWLEQKDEEAQNAVCRNDIKKSLPYG